MTEASWNLILIELTILIHLKSDTEARAVVVDWPSDHIEPKEWCVSFYFNAASRECRLVLYTDATVNMGDGGGWKKFVMMKWRNISGLRHHLRKQFSYQWHSEELWILTVAFVINFLASYGWLVKSRPNEKHFFKVTAHLRLRQVRISLWIYWQF